jgi:hypothetical protein
MSVTVSFPDFATFVALIALIPDDDEECTGASIASTEEDEFRGLREGLILTQVKGEDGSVNDVTGMEFGT